MRQNTQIYDAQNFIYVAAMPKSASSLMWLIVSAIQEPDSRPDASKLDLAVNYSFLPMSLEYLSSFPRGGVFKNHAPMEYHNDLFLKQTGCKYVVLTRHPADQLAALYCHLRDPRNKGGPDPPAERQTTWDFSVGQYPAGTFDAAPEIAIGRLIECGCLFKSLLWMADWIAFRHPAQSRLLCYEDVLENFESVVTELCWFIRGAPPDDDLMRYLVDVFSHEISEGRKKSTLERYSGGWTGHIGIWRNYFSDENIEAYNMTVDIFMRAYPQGKALSATYPNLIISRNPS